MTRRRITSPGPCTTRESASRRLISTRPERIRWNAEDARKGRSRPSERAPAPQSVSPNDISSYDRPEAWAANLARALVEVRLGRRSLGGLRRWLQPHLCAALLQQSELPPPSSCARSARVRRTRVQSLSPASAEICVIVEDYGHVYAVAMRVEKHRHRWHITALEMG
ncbi:Rv3235 family protein [Scrofimicrobium canadense]|uniref:Rv3235 family protein n=1 Tax=Scrofimicrobium canadense TaxID=2652290 RepID=UPI001CED36E4|nr:Rv3235 family protein [Scrofimicrobium canadense]